MALRPVLFFQLEELQFELKLILVALRGSNVAGGDEYLRLTAEGHATDGETAKHTFHLHHIDLP